MFSHVVLGSNDIERSKVFYDAILAAMGGAEGVVDDMGRVFYRHKGSVLLITRPINGEPATHANGGTIGFSMSQAEVDAWHAAGLAHGGTTCEDPPGPRTTMPIYLAYLRDPDGNKLCAMHWMGPTQ